MAAEYKRGAHWAMRRNRKLGEPASRVELLMWVDKKPPRVKVKHLDGELAGLEEFVSPLHLQHPWKEWPASLRWERAELALIEAIDKEPLNAVAAKAAALVLTATGEDLFVDDWRGYTRYLDVSALERVAARAGWAPDRTPWRFRPNFIRDDRAWLANEHLVALARDFASTNPDPVLLYIDEQESEQRHEGMEGSTFSLKMLREDGPMMSIARDWAGGAARSQLAHDVRQLKALLYQALNELRRAGCTAEADKIQRRLERYSDM